MRVTGNSATRSGTRRNSVSSDLVWSIWRVRGNKRISFPTSRLWYVIGVHRADEKPTGQESLAERWLFHKLNAAIKEVNETLEIREFQRASTAAYSFFLYDLCDVFIEATKPLFEANEESPAKLSAQNTLYTCLEAGLKLLHPFMPYVTEDLWQRLPRRPEDTCDSIMISSFPEFVSQRQFRSDATYRNTC